MRRATPATVLVGLAVLLGPTGCGASSDGGGTSPAPASSGSAPSGAPATSTSPTAASPSAAAMAAALPSAKDVPGADPTVESCAFDRPTDTCPAQSGLTYASATLSLGGTRAAVDDTNAPGTHWLHERVRVTALRLATPRDAAAKLAENRAADEAVGSTLDIPATAQSGGGFTLGVKGTVASRPYTAPTGAAGYELTRAFSYSTPQGVTSAPYDSAYVAVVLGSYVVTVDVQRWASNGRADALARTLMQQYLARVAG